MGEGTNTKAELLGIWATLTLASHLSLLKIQACGDSRVIIDWLNGKANLQGCSIEGWKSRIQDLLKDFQATSFHHVYREFNKEADQLSKSALTDPEGKISYYQWEPGGMPTMEHLYLF
jgi:ribonuclease HI